MKTPWLAVLLLLSAATSWAADSASFLDIGVGARPLAMGGAYAAIADDPNSIYWNPAGLSRVKKTEISVSHAELAQNMRHDFVAFARPTSLGTFGLGATYLSLGDLDGRDGLGHPTGSFSASDGAFALGFGRPVGGIDAGLSVKYLRSHIGSAEAQSFALDAGLSKQFEAAAFGLAVRNAGPGLKFDNERNDLPLRLVLGGAYKITGGHAVTAEVTNGPRGSGTDVGFGGEFQAAAGIFLRGGYTTKSSITGGKGFDAASGMTLGFGVNRSAWSLDYAVEPMGELGASHRFTIGWRF